MKEIVFETTGNPETQLALDKIMHVIGFVPNGITDEESVEFVPIVVAPDFH